MYSQVGIFDEGGFGPFAGFGAVVGFDMAVDWVEITQLYIYSIDWGIPYLPEP